jgi:uncharacterized peroxidase-related enzyme
MSFQVHTVESAPQDSRETLASIKQRYGFIPNLAGVFAESPGAFKGLLSALQTYDDESLTLTATERQIVLLAVSVSNRCDYCTAAHSMLIHSLGVSKDEIAALQQGRALGDERLETLRRFTEQLVENRGWVDDSVTEGFLTSGFTKAQVLEVILGISVKTLTNFANHVAKPVVNPEFRPFLPDWAAAA